MQKKEYYLVDLSFFAPRLLQKMRFVPNLLELNMMCGLIDDPKRMFKTLEFNALSELCPQLFSNLLYVLCTFFKLWKFFDGYLHIILVRSMMYYGIVLLWILYWIFGFCTGFAIGFPCETGNCNDNVTDLTVEDCEGVCVSGIDLCNICVG